KALRKPFPREVVGILPKPYKKESPKGKCNECNGFHGLPAVHLDFVGHAAITDRLLSVDPEWSWEPMALTTEGLPQLDRQGNLWIRLTVCGTTRIGVGDGMSMKELIGDALRNAAMRFGVALDLWSKDELESTLDQPEKQNIPKAKAGPKPDAEQSTAKSAEPMSTRTRGQMFALFAEHGITEDRQKAGIGRIIGHPIESRADLTEAQGLAVIAALRAMPKPAAVSA
ncbi:MAG: hypothetical protein H7Z19_09875, partial [Chitinophagaceae bacterium]|nr:hypothetical protein [Rubrivivax sp.]